MHLSKVESLKIFRDWIIAWNEHNLDKVMALFHDNIVFENWTGATICGKNQLRKAWASWFLNHKGFLFNEEDIFFDEENQKLLYQWQLDWPSTEISYIGKHETRRGIDVIHFEDGKIVKKYTYSKTTIQIEGNQVSLHAK